MNKFIILGCGSSLGSPTITNYWGACDKNNKKNVRTRCSAYFRINDISVLIDTSPDIKNQIKLNKIKNIDAIIYSHEHADQTSGIFELRPFFWKNKKKLSIYGRLRTVKDIVKRYDFIFRSKKGYSPIAKANIIGDFFSINKKKNKIRIKSFEVNHGIIKSTAYVINKVAYISDCNSIPKKNEKFLYNLNYLIIDCFRYKQFPTHLSFKQSLEISKKFKPKKTILTNLHVDLDYNSLKKKLPSNIIPAFDGMSFTF